MNFRKKPVVIQAVQVKGGNNAEIADFMGMSPRFTGPGVEIDTLEGTMRASESDWIIKGVKGEFYPCRDDIFAATYDPAD